MKTSPTLPTTGKRPPHPLQQVVGRIGTFTDFNGRVFSCLVTGHDGQLLLKISYVRDGEVIHEAYIDKDNFEDDSPNRPSSSAA